MFAVYTDICRYGSMRQVEREGKKRGGRCKKKSAFRTIHMSNANQSCEKGQGKRERRIKVCIIIISNVRQRK